MGGGFLISYCSGITEFLTGHPIVVGEDPLALIKIDELGKTPVTTAAAVIEQPSPIIKPRETVAGWYLVSLHAQRDNDWKTAYTALRSLLDMNAPEGPDREALILRAMVLAVGSGNFADGLAFARMSDVSQANSLPLLFLAVDAFQRKDNKAASEYLAKMQNGAISDFMMPLLNSWLKAAQGQYDTASLTRNPMHYYHAVLIADFMGRQQQIAGLLGAALSQGNVQALDLERIADAYTHIGQYDEAVRHYRNILEILPDARETREKLTRLEKGEQVDFFENVEGPPQGVARALYDMARILYQDFSDESALIFGNLAVQLDPSLVGARVLMGAIASRAQRYDEAIAQYRMIGPDSQHYADARLQIASLMEAAGRHDEALAELSALPVLEGMDQPRTSIRALIQMGDLERRREDFTAALVHYNKAADMIGPSIPDEYSELYYVRGMAHERLGQWEDAEKDLQAALQRMPEDPYVLNYLGYAWADRGQHLTKALSMIKQAADAKPADGYITDSLGWVYYRMGEYERALPYLEKAALLQPGDAVINDHLGDLYWKLGRKIEARFQWMRAKNGDDAESMMSQLDQKIASGLPAHESAPRLQAVVENVNKPAVPPVPAAEKTF